MFEALQIALIAVDVALLVLTSVHLVRDREPGWLLVGGLAVLEAGLLVQLVAGIVRVAGSGDDVNGAVYIGYLVGSVLILPVAVLWSAAERSRSGTAVLAVALVVVPVLILRLQQIWAGG